MKPRTKKGTQSKKQESPVQALDRLLDQERQERAAAEKAAAEARAKREEEHRAARRLEQLAELSEAQVRRLAKAGRLTADEVAGWFEVT
ncbi:MAG: hypothetical protein U0599_29065, partial [Vicinamibacteria bacterium]